MTQGPSNSDESIRIQETLISIGAKISQSIREAVEEAADNIDATVAQRVGRSLVTTFTNLAKFSQDTANNAFKIGQGLLTSEGISKQLLDLEEKKLALLRQQELAKLAGIKFNPEDAKAALDSITAQELILEHEKAITDEVQKKIGLTGKLAESLKAVPGLGKLIDAKKLEEDLRKAAVQVDANGNIALKNVNRYQMMGKGIQLLGKQIATSLFDPLTIATALVTKFLEFNKAAVDVQRLTGQIGTSFNIMANGAASATQILETAAELTKEIGFNAQNAFSQEVIANAADLKVEMGLAAGEANAFAMMSQTSGQSVDGIVDSVVATTSAFNASNRSAVSQGQVLRDVAKTSDAIKLSLANNPTALANAAAQARRLGMDLNGVNKIAESLLNFESSIEKELEAQLLTGNQMNLSKAREMALTNDLEGLGREIFNNTVDINKFGQMNVLAQQAQAEALGMTRDELARVAYLRALETGMTEEQAAAAANVNAEDMKRLTAQENFTASINKLVSALAPVMEIISELVSIPFLGPAIAGAALLIPSLGILAGSLTSIGTLFGINTVAATTNTVATTAQTAANTGLATSNTAVTATGTATSGVFASMGAALGSFGVSAAAAIPVLLSIAAVAGGIGLAFMGLAQALKTIPDILKEITLEKAASVAVLATSFASLAAGLAAVALAGPMALPVLLAAGALAAGIGMISTAGGGATENPQGVPQSIGMEPVVSEIKLMREEMGALLKQLVAKDTTINMDGYQVGRAISLSSVNQ